MKKLFLLGLMILPSAFGQTNWPQFRGENALGVASNRNLPLTWSTQENVAWSVTIPGWGWSSPIVWGEKILVTSVVRDGEVEPPKKGLYFGGERPTPSKDLHHWMVHAFDWQSGKKIWEREVHQGSPGSSLHLKNTYASETPVTDGERIYAYFGNLGLYCLDLDGKELWSQKWGHFKTRNGWGTAASPVLHGNRIFVVNDNEEKSFLVALDKTTGKELWRVDRDEKSNWATPYVWQNTQRVELIVPGRKRVRSYDLEGKVLWELGGMSSIVIPTPFAKDGLLYVCSGYVGDNTRPVFAVRPGAAGDITLKEGETKNEYIAWCERTAAPYNPSPLVYGDYFYVLFDFGFLSCRDARTGQEVYAKQRISPDGNIAFTASPWAYDGKVFCLSEDGDTYVFQAGREFKLLGKNSLGEMCMATPAIARESVIVRTATKLYRIKNGAANAKN
jgi:outer membrane protein assembly factor BamB